MATKREVILLYALPNAHYDYVTDFFYAYFSTMQHKYCFICPSNSHYRLNGPLWPLFFFSLCPILFSFFFCSHSRSISTPLHNMRHTINRVWISLDTLHGIHTTMHSVQSHVFSNGQHKMNGPLEEKKKTKMLLN